MLAEDIVAAGGQQVAATPGGASFTGNWEACYRVNLESRIATRVLWRVASADFNGPPRSPHSTTARLAAPHGGTDVGLGRPGADYLNEADIYQLANGVAWPKLFKVEHSIRVYVTAVRAPFKSIEFVTLKVKDAVCDRFRADCGLRPDVNTAAPAVRIHLFVTDKTATLYLDTSGEPLWLRGQKIAKVAAPLKENLAAGVLRLAGWTPDQPLLDPMCGSGTLLLEAAGMALNDAPGLARDMQDFGFTRLSNYQPSLWRKLCMEAAERRVPAPPRLQIWGSDIDDDAVARTRQNLAHAGLEDMIELRRADLLEIDPPTIVGNSGGILIANPPYGERLGEATSLDAFYPQLGDALKKRFAGWHCWFLSADPHLPKLIGLKPARRIPLYNGALECRLYGFPMVAGSAREPARRQG
ncbi:MAG: THUMP domain-containing protein [Rhodocyclaceae bacterium]|nr:THUMP domain-containing protein [Rhodocyclaceae bacterium]MDP3033200.1 THUMP domain-containing protein [Rhodocyclaceae bacterium]